MGRNTRRLRWSAAGAVAVLAVGGGTAYAVTGSTDAPHYRTVAAVTGDVEQTLASSGTVDAAHRADLGFATAGTVAALRVAVGDTVKAGQVLAVLDTTDLDAAVTEAKAKLAQAVAQLASDRTAQTSAVEQASAPSGQSSGSGSGKPSGSGQSGSGHSGTGAQTTPSTSASNAATAATVKALKALQDKVIAAQSTASAALAAAKSALAAQTAACADAYQEPAASAGDDATADDSSDASTDSSTDAADDDAAVSAACSTALAEVQDRQQDVSDAQDVLAAALTDLSSALTKALGKVTATGSTTTGAHPTAARVASSATVVSTVAVRTVASTPSTSSGQSGNQGGTTVTAARLAADQADIEQADADLVTAQQARAAAKLRSTRSGKVAALDAAVGDTVAAGDTVATVIGGRAVTVLGSVAEAKVGLVKTGQKVRVTVPGSTKAADGVVTAIGLTADTSSGSTTYPVTVTVEDPSIALPTGSQASLTIVLSTAEDVVTVPLSAVVAQGEGAVVRVWDGKNLTRKQVTVGATGTRTVAIASGLSAGTEVVLAAVDDPISGASSTVNERGGFGGGPTGQFRRSGTGGGGFATRVTR